MTIMPMLAEFAEKKASMTEGESAEGLNTEELGSNQELFEIDDELLDKLEDLICSEEGALEKQDVEEVTESARHIICRNEGLEGDRHPVTGVPFERDYIIYNGEKIEGVFPEFESIKDCQLPESLYEARDRDQFAYANQELKEAVENDPELASKFSPEQLEQIKNGDRPDGYVWHHHQEPGKLQLIDRDTHDKTGHTGGKLVWGGGSENR